MAIQHPEQFAPVIDDLPLVHAEVFSRHPQAAYYVGVLAVDGMENGPAYLAARQLRFERYNDLGWLPDSSRDLDGGEHDQFDEDAVQFGVIKNSLMGPRMIATSRLIRKTTKNPILPVEADYPEVFTDNPAGLNDVEVSRLISASSDKRERHAASLAIQRAMIGWCSNNGVDKTHAMVEPYLAKIFDQTGVPYEKRSDFKPIPEYANTENAVVTIDPMRMAQTLRAHRIGMPIATSLFFHNINKTQGQGFYGRHFLKRYK